MTESSVHPTDPTRTPSPRSSRFSGLRAPIRPGRVVGAAVVVALVILLATFLGAFSPGSGSSGGGSGAVTFRTAMATAAAVADLNGSWDLEGVLGLDLASAGSLPINLTSPANCTVRSIVGPVPSNLSLPAFHGDLGSGDGQEWLLSYFDPAISARLWMVVSGGVVTLGIEWACLPSPPCRSACLPLTAIPSTVVDSSVAVSAAFAAGGEVFLASHPTGVSVEMSLIPLLGLGNTSFWSVGFTTCPEGYSENESQASGASYGMEVNATTGVVVPWSEESELCTVSTGPTTPIGQALTPGTPVLFRGTGTGGTIASQGCTSGDFCYRVPIENATDNVTPMDLEMEVVSGIYSTPFSTVGFAILSADGQVLVSSNGPMEALWTPGLGSPTMFLNVSMTFVVDGGSVNPAGEALALEFIGLGPFNGSDVEIALT